MIPTSFDSLEEALEWGTRIRHLKGNSFYVPAKSVAEVGLWLRQQSAAFNYEFDLGLMVMTIPDDALAVHFKLRFC